jgi:hypothetical protein
VNGDGDHLPPGFLFARLVFVYRHDTNSGLNFDFGLNDFPRFFAAGKLGGFLPLTGPGAAASVKLPRAAQIRTEKTA